MASSQVSDSKMLEMKIAELSENRVIESARKGNYLPEKIEREQINIPRMSEPFSSSPFMDEDDKDP